MFGWFRRNVRRIGILGVEVEFHPPPPDPPRIADKSTDRAADLSAAATPATIPPVPTPPVVPGRSDQPPDPLARDRDAFLAKIEELLGAPKRDEYAPVLDDLIAWSRATGRLEFRPKVPTSEAAQATVSFYVRGGALFWEVYPRKGGRDAKCSCLSSIDRRVPEELKSELVRCFAELSASGVPDSPEAPTLSFDDLRSEAARVRLKRLLADALARVAD